MVMKSSFAATPKKSWCCSSTLAWKTMRVISSSRDAIMKTFRDENGHRLSYSRVPDVSCPVIHGFTCNQRAESPFRRSSDALLCSGTAYSSELVSLMFAITAADDPFDAHEVLAARPGLPETWAVHAGVTER